MGKCARARRRAATELAQCIQLPGDISTLVLDCLLIACSSRGCAVFFRSQNVICVDGAAEIVELLALLLDEQGIQFFTPLPAAWPHDHAAGAGSVANQEGLERVC